VIDQRNDVCNSNHKSECVTKKSMKQVFRVVGVNVNGFGLYQVVGLQAMLKNDASKAMKKSCIY
jgi:hypothetical protein